MKILQFKRNNEAKRTDLSEGELYIDTSAKQVWVGTNNKQNPFTIKAYPTCLYDNSKLAVSSVVVNVDTSGQTLAVTKLLPDGSTTTSYPSITIPGTADYAKKLVTNGSSAITEGSSTRPVYFNNGVPIAVSGVGNSSWKPNIMVGAVSANTITTDSTIEAPSAVIGSLTVSSITTNIQRKFLGTDQNKKIIGYTLSDIVNGADITYLQYNYLANKLPLWSGTKSVTTSGVSAASVNMDLPGLYVIVWEATGLNVAEKITSIIYYDGTNTPQYSQSINAINKSYFIAIVSKTVRIFNNTTQDGESGTIYRVIQIG